MSRMTRALLINSGIAAAIILAFGALSGDLPGPWPWAVGMAAYSTALWVAIGYYRKWPRMALVQVALSNAPQSAALGACLFWLLRQRPPHLLQFLAAVVCMGAVGAVMRIIAEQVGGVTQPGAR